MKVTRTTKRRKNSSRFRFDLDGCSDGAGNLCSSNLVRSRLHSDGDEEWSCVLLDIGRDE